jgi:hypothetical protein
LSKKKKKQNIQSYFNEEPTDKDYKDTLLLNAAGEAVPLWSMKIGNTQKYKK